MPMYMVSEKKHLEYTVDNPIKIKAYINTARASPCQVNCLALVLITLI
jgi:hypothetical protein